MNLCGKKFLFSAAKNMSVYLITTRAAATVAIATANKQQVDAAEVATATIAYNNHIMCQQHQFFCE